MRSPSDENWGRSLRVVWTGDSETDCVENCRDLQLADIKYRVSQTPTGLEGRMGVSWKFAIGVSSSDFEAAKTALGLNVEPSDSMDEGLELRDTDSTARGALPDESEIRTSNYLKSWRPEEATVMIWTQSASDTPSIVPLALTENLIHYRIERGEDGVQRYFVLPDDEARSREILRQIKDGEPPE